MEVVLLKIFHGNHKTKTKPEGFCDIADQLNLSVAFSCSANSQPIKITEELNWLTIDK